MSYKRWSRVLRSKIGVRFINTVRWFSYNISYQINQLDRRNVKVYMKGGQADVPYYTLNL